MDDLDLEPGLVRAVCAGRVVGCGRVELGAVVVGCGDRQRRASSATTSIGGRAAGFTPSVGEPDRAADRAFATPTASRRARTSTGWLPRMRPGIWGRPRTRPRPRSAIRVRRLRRVRWRAVGAVGRATLSWSASTDNVGVVRYNVHRGTSAGFAASVANRIAQPTHAGLCGYHRRRAATSTRSLPRTRPATSARSRTRRRRRCWRHAPRPASRRGLTGSVVGSTVNLSWTGSTDNVGVTRYNVHRCTSAGFTPSAANRIAQPTGTSYADTGLATGSYFYKVTAEDAAGNISAASNEATATVADATPPTAPSSLAAGRCRQHRQPQLGGSHRQRRRQPLQPPPRHHQRLHPQRRQPDRATDRAQLRRHRRQPRQLLLQADRRRRRRQHQPRLQHRQRHRPRHDSPPSTPTNLAATGGAGQSQPHLDRSHRQRRRHAATTSTARPRSGFTPSAGNRVAQPTDHQLHRHRPRRRHLLLQAHRRRRRRQPQRRLNRSHRHRQRPTRHRPRRRLRLRHRQRHQRRRPIRHRQQRHHLQRHLDHHRQVRTSPLLQRHQRLRHHPRRQQPRPHHRHDPRSLGPTPPTSAPTGAPRSSRRRPAA